jgi:hypothetical protein
MYQKNEGFLGKKRVKMARFSAALSPKPALLCLNPLIDL